MRMLNRRNFMRAGIVAASTVATGFVYRKLNRVGSGGAVVRSLANLSPTDRAPASGFRADEAKTPFEDITHYNNFYEFSTDKEGVAEASPRSSSTAAVEGRGRRACAQAADVRPRRPAEDRPPEERVYRMRCVEAWSMVIPWVGFSLSKLLDRVEPLSSAKYVAFETLLDPEAHAEPEAPACSSGRTSKACAWTRRCTR